MSSSIIALLAGRVLDEMIASTISTYVNAGSSSGTADTSKVRLDPRRFKTDQVTDFALLPEPFEIDNNSAEA
jgi:hypothetical protein